MTAATLAPAAAIGGGLLLLLAERARSRRVREVAGPRHARIVPGADRPGVVGPLAIALGVLAVAWAALSLPADAAAPEDGAGGSDVVLCLDVSRSMLAPDVAPDRLTAAKRAVRALCERARGDRLALVVFAGEARLAVPLTRDLRSLADLADAADPASVSRGGTDLAAALAKATEALTAGRGDRRAAVCLLTDGEDLAGHGERAAAALAGRGVAVHAVGFGSALGGKIPEEGGPRWVAAPAGGDVVTALDLAGLRRLAAAGDGEAVDAGDAGDALVSLWERRIATRPAADSSRGAGTVPRVQAALAAALLLWSVDLALGRRRRR